MKIYKITTNYTNLREYRSKDHKYHLKLMPIIVNNEQLYMCYSSGKVDFYKILNPGYFWADWANFCNLGKPIKVI